MKKHIDPIIIVEGKYDKIKLESLIDGLIIATDGFAIFKDKDAQSNLKMLTKMHGAIILTDSDRAGFIIRRYLHSILQGYTLYDIYIPDVYGKEKRKTAPGAEGKLGVEGMSADVLSTLLATFERPPLNHGDSITSADLFEMGLFGGKDSAAKRRAFQSSLGLPGRLNKNALLKILNSMFTREQLLEQIKKWSCELYLCNII